jgi:subtilisin family serine protease
MMFPDEFSLIQPVIPIDTGGLSTSSSVGYGLDLEQSLQYGNQQIQSLSTTNLSLLDNTLTSARNIGSLTGSQTFSDFVGSSDTNDYYRFNLIQSSNFNLSLTGLSADADTQLLNSSGTVIQSSQNAGRASESISRSLSAGTYYVRVYPYSGNTNYSLTLSAAPTDQAGNTLATARNIGTLSGSQTFSDFVGGVDTNDYYRFDLTQTSTFNLSLNGLSANADTQLLNSSGTVIQSSQNGGTTSESISRSLSAGTYYVRVYPNLGNTNYSLTLSAAPTDQAGNTLATARNIGTLSGSQTFSDFVGSVDTNDYYRFDLTQTSTFNLSLNGLSADADTQLLNSSGTVIQSSQNGGTTSESISRSLSAGTYYVRVYPYSGNTSYSLTLSAVSSPPPPTSGFNSTYGYGMINAARSVAAALGQSSPFPDVANLGGNNWGNDLVGAPEVWSRGYTGQGVVVAVVDTGVDYTHSDLDANIWVNTREISGNGIDDDGNGYIDDIRGWDFVGNDNDPRDGNSHGTHVAGTIAAENNGTGATGVAYNARIMPVRVLDNDGSGSYLGVANGIRYAANNGARVINLSLGGGYSSDIYSAIQYATGRGAIVVMAAGNDGSLQPGYPAYHATEYGLAIGAVDSSSNIASFSNRAGTDNAMRYVVAPGVSIYSTVPNNGYATYSGTSMATPHAAGVIALMLSANSSLTTAQVRDIVTSRTTYLAGVNSFGVATTSYSTQYNRSSLDYDLPSGNPGVENVQVSNNTTSNMITTSYYPSYLNQSLTFNLPPNDLSPTTDSTSINPSGQDNDYVYLEDNANYSFNLSTVLGLSGKPMWTIPSLI